MVAPIESSEVCAYRTDNRNPLLTGKRRACQTTGMPELILEDQRTILASQQAMHDNRAITKQNQESLPLILKNQEKIFALLQK